MERSIKISLEKAREWYNSGNTSLKEVALQAFKEGELVENPWELIKTFEDACRVLSINPKIVDLIFDDHLKNMYKLRIVKEVLNGANWTPKFNTGDIYYPLLKYYPKKEGYVDNKYIPITNFKDLEDNKVYTLFGGNYDSYGGGLGSFGYVRGGVYPDHGLLSCRSKEIAIYFGVTFGKLIFDAIYGQYKNYTWV